MSEFRFAQLGWIHAVWIALLIAALLVLFEFRGRSVLDQLISRMMQTRLVHRTSLLRRVTAIVLATLSMILLIVALMRPQWGRTVQQVVRVDSQIMICLDVSKSMLAEDVAPNRLERAKVELDSLLGLMRDGQQVGLIAFAGKAAVLCPMTTDFGFLRLILSEGEPESVGLGGTKIGAAIQTALDGFREAGDIHRMILLITDGEDHDSFPLEAAKRAKENGVRIVSVGFGDEAGSKIEITDPATGVRSFLKDRDGKEVVSRLDGETLRDIALATDGAYVPAGTGALDLESIYRSHIATLLKGSLESEQRVIRNEAFQWFVLAAIVLLIMSLISATPWNLRTRALVASQAIAAQAPKAASGAALLWCTLLLGQSSSAQQLPTAGPPPVPQVQPLPQTASQLEADAPTELPDAKKSDGTTGSPDDALDDTLPPRTIYNQALALVHTDPDRAERYLNHARSEAGTDGELRFRTLYNLGWVEVNRADAKLQAEPQQALQYLHQAANRFREAIRVRPENSEARQNLEILSRRILELTDALREKNPQEIAARLDALIEQTRAHQGEMQALVQQIGRSDEGTSVDAYRAEFRRLAVAERQLISDTQQFTDDARTQLDAIVKKPDEEKKPEEKLQSVQLQNMLAKIDNGIQRMNKSRSLTRRLQGDAAFRRWSSALSDLKQARDQLRNPVEVLGQIIGDANEMASLTQLLAQGSLSLTEEDSASQIPAWLTNEYIADLLSVAIQRTSELEEVFTNISAAQEPAAQNSTATPPKEELPAETPDPQTEQLLKNIAAATPLVRQAKELLELSNTELESKALDAAYQKQMEGISELAKAWELFFDIRRLIELLYQQQQLVQGAIQQSASQPEIVPQLIGPLADAEELNLQRCQRLAELIQIAKDQLPAADAQTAPAPLGPPLPPGSQPPATAPGAGANSVDANSETQQADAQRQQLETAQQLLGQVIKDIQQARELLQSDVTAEEPAAAPPDATAPAATAPVEPVEPTAEPEPQPDAQPDVAPEKPPVQPPVDASSATVEPATNENTDTTAAAGPLGEVGTAVDRSLKSLEELRRLFFSLVEHLRDTTQRQSNLNDETTELGAKSDPLQPEKIGPLAMRQQQLQNIAQQIAEALKQQSDQAATAASQQAGAAQPTQGPNPQGPSPQDATAAAEKLAQAGGLVDTAQNSMQAAAKQLLAISQGSTQGKEPLALAQEGQTEALKKLLEALALLDENNQQDQQQQDQNQDQQQQQQQQDQNQQQQQQMDANQLLQLIRDREAERRKDKNRRAAASGSAVDKDW